MTTHFVGHMFYSEGRNITEVCYDAMEHYEQVYGKSAALILVNPGQPLEEVLTDDTVIVEQSAYILPGHILVGKPTGEL